MLSVTNQNSPSFGQINVIRVSKKAFSKPENFRNCAIEFVNGINKAQGNLIGRTKAGFYLQQILYRLGMKNKSATALLGYLESMPIKAELEEVYHSFAFFTGKDNDIYTDLYRSNKKQVVNKTRESLKQAKWQRYGVDIEGMPTFKEYIIGAKAIANKYMSEIHQKAFENAKVKEFRINNLDELKNIKSKLGL